MEQNLKVAEVNTVPRSVGRVLDLFEIIVDGQCTLTQAATRSGLTPTTARRHLQALEARGYVDRDGRGRYGVGPTIFRIAASLRDGGEVARMIAAAQPHLDALANETGESAYLAVSDAKTATYVATAESTRAIRHVGWVGQNVRLAGTAVGDALAEPGVVVKRTGAVEPDITAVSVALDPESNLGFAVSVIGPAHRLIDTSPIEGALRVAAEALGRDLGLDRQEVPS
jgi:DNA-binding IclR family transcriptional regulator